VTDSYHSIVGLPGSGKTTFLAALWHLIDAGEIESQLVLDKLVGNHVHLNNLVDAWRRCQEVPRTPMGGDEEVTIHVHQPQTGRRLVLGFPDLSGESFAEQFATRACNESYLEGADRVGGVLVFVNADRPNDGLTIADLGPAIEGEGSPEAEVNEWSPTHVPEQVKLVDLLQFLQRPPFGWRKRRLVVAVSAWDVVHSPGPTPDEWLARELPFLDQFLRHNPDSFDLRIYGISAQGGAITDATRQALAAQVPSERITCVYQNDVGHDITAPLLWLTGDE